MNTNLLIQISVDEAGVSIVSARHKKSKKWVEKTIDSADWNEVLKVVEEVKRDLSSMLVDGTVA